MNVQSPILSFAANNSSYTHVQYLSDIRFDVTSNNIVGPIFVQPDATFRWLPGDRDILEIVEYIECGDRRSSCHEQKNPASAHIMVDGP